MIINLYRHRGYICRTALADLRNRYAGSTMGVVWNILQPLALIAVFSLVFTQITPIPAKGELGGPWLYTLYLCSALLPWLAFGESVNRGTYTFIENSVYLRKLSIPEQVFSAQTAVTSLFSVTISMSLLLMLAVLIGHAPGWQWLLLPVPLVLLIGIGFGMGMFFGTLNAFIRDVGQIVPIIMQVAFWSFPIVYHPKFVPEVMRTIISWMPWYPHLTAIRSLFLDYTVPEPALWAWMFGWTALFGIVGYLVLRKLRPELRDVL